MKVIDYNVGRIANEIIDGIIADLSDRRGLRQEWEGIDEDIRLEIRETWTSICLMALEGEGK